MSLLCSYQGTPHLSLRLFQIYVRYVWYLSYYSHPTIYLAYNKYLTVIQHEQQCTHLYSVYVLSVFKLVFPLFTSLKYPRLLKASCSCKFANPHGRWPVNYNLLGIQTHRMVGYTCIKRETLPIILLYGLVNIDIGQK